jgi:hypothetical protein
MKKYPNQKKNQSTIPQFAQQKPNVNQMSLGYTQPYPGLPQNIFAISQPATQNTQGNSQSSSQTTKNSSQNSSQNKQNGKNKNNKDNAQNTQGTQNTQNTQKQDGYKGKFNNNKKKFFFVKPWPQDKKYMSKNGNQLSKECNEWFQGFCFKCGHSSHSYDKCKTYPETTTFLSLCSKCYQGFHEQCRRRYIRESEVHDQLKQMQLMYDHLAMHPPQAPFMLTDGTVRVQSPNSGEVIEPEDDED